MDAELFNKLFEQFRLFFSLPTEEKMKILADANNRGYTPYQEETLNPSLQSVGDTKEGLYFGREAPRDDPTPLHGPNQWPDPSQVPLFRPIVMQYYEACTKVAFRSASISCAVYRVFCNGAGVPYCGCCPALSQLSCVGSCGTVPFQ